MAVDYPNWFAEIAQANFEEFLKPAFEKAPNLCLLQLGVFTGDASLWIAQNILGDSTSWLYDVDTWEGAANEPAQEVMDFKDVYETYLNKIRGYDKVVHFKSQSVEFLINYTRYIKFDFIYVDAHHTSASALLDSELSWRVLKPNGILAIDDYLWEHPNNNPIHAPKLGIEMFLDRHEGEFDLLAMNSQVWIKKK